MFIVAVGNRSYITLERINGEPAYSVDDGAHAYIHAHVFDDEGTAIRVAQACDGRVLAHD